MALISNRCRSWRNKGHYSSPNNPTTGSSCTSPVTCQICFKNGHVAAPCWHHLKMQYVPSFAKNANKDLVAGSPSSYTSWYLDSGASSHLTNSLDNLSISTLYQGSYGITISNGNLVSIAQKKAFLSSSLFYASLHLFFLSKIISISSFISSRGTKNKEKN